MQFSLLSTEFIVLVWLAVIAAAISQGAVRQFIFLFFNIGFLYVLLLGPAGALSTIAFCLFGYLLTRFIQAQPRYGLAVALVAYVSLFAYMRQYAILTWVLPEGLIVRTLSTIGLSFLFFKVVHVMVDARAETLGTFSLLTYLNYCLNFTTFVMGPIQRYQDFSSQWVELRETVPASFETHFDAVLRILLGATKAYVLAEWFQTRALQPDTNLLELSWIGLVVHVYAFYFYLYLNFSGYCDIAIGAGTLLGVRPPENFNLPFLAQNVSDFWQRQHRSLTLWLTDYVFSPVYKWALSKPRIRSYPLLAMSAALMITMLISGLWHGTTLGFLLFGAVHGLYLVIYRVWDAFLTKRWGSPQLRTWRSRWPVRIAGTALTFNATAFAFIFFQLDATRLSNLLSELV